MVNPRASGLKIATFSKAEDYGELASSKTLARKEALESLLTITLYLSL